eukprot:TRINITY_DN6244_c0_g1_i1.p1 TRINITY_DN6244_c0_g1~~TRINITY_DN6244_c0_g1_i1.p1  ORF type:complete len:297 (+),score=41.04 TRINITY_DN6244_c0_g1_i1:116-1006(+)
MNEPSPPPNRLFAELLGGTVGGVMQVIVGHPLDTVKIRLQSEQGGKYYKGSVDCLTKTVRQEGMRGLYKGVGPPLVMIGVLNGVMFSTNGQMKRLVAWGFDKPSVNELSLPQVVLAAFMTAPVYCAVLTPTEYVKSTLQFQSAGVERMYSGPMDVIRKTVQKEGVLGLFKGYTVTVGTRILGSPWYFASYELFKRQFYKLNGESKMHLWQTMLAGGAAGAMFWAGNFPVDSIRTRIQTQRGARQTIGATALGMYREGGVGAFYRGFGAAFIRSFPANAVVFLGLEWTLKLLGYSNF